MESNQIQPHHKISVQAHISEDIQTALMRKIAELAHSLAKANAETAKANGQIQKANSAINSWRICSQHNQAVARKHKIRANRAEAQLAECRAAQ